MTPQFRTRTMSRLVAGLAGCAMTLGLLGGCAAGPVSQVSSAQSTSQPAGPPAPAAKRYNVLLLIADDMNTRLGTYGADVRTPNIDRLANEGVKFQRAYTQFPICGESRASFLTGLRPNTIGESALYERFRCTVPDTVTMPQWFMQNGYFSGRVGKVYHQGVPSDIGRSGPDDTASWEVAINPRGRDKDVEDLVENFTPGIPGLGRANAVLADSGEDEDYTDGKVASEAIRLLREHKQDPFFLAVGFYRPHVPEIVPKKYFDLYPADKVKMAVETTETLAQVPAIATNTDVMNLGMTPEQQRRMIQAYQGATTFADAQVGQVLDELDRLGLSDNTVVLFLGDHGWMLGEHGQWQKSLLWEESVHVPMIIRAPGLPKGTTIKQVVEMLDIYPTIAQLAGLPANSANEGVSLAELMRDPAHSSFDRPAFSQIRGGRSVRTDRWRYTEWGGGQDGRQLFDHKADPLEHHNLADNPKYAKVQAHLSDMLQKDGIEARGYKTLSYPQGGAPRRGPRPVVHGCDDLWKLVETGK